MKILIIEDDQETRNYISKGLTERGHTTDTASDGTDGLFLAREGSYDVIVLDRMLPQMDGLTVLKNLRSSNIKTPILFLTALGGLEDRVQGLEMGGDDYLVKPFAFSELYARLNSLSRRSPLPQEVETQLSCADLKLNLIERTVHRGTAELDLLPTEFRLLEYLLRNKGKIVTRTMLLEHVWDFHFDPKSNVVETHISRLRSKVDRDFEHELITTVRGLGYKIEA